MRAADRKGRGLRLGLFLFLTAACSSPTPPTVLMGRTMGTAYTIKFAAQRLSAQDQTSLHAAVETRLAEINALMSTYDPNSELSRFNALNDDRSFPVSGETAFVVKAALRTARRSAGAFDPTVGPLVDLWGFGPQGAPKRVPTPVQIDAARASVGWERLVVQEAPWRLRKRVPGLRVDLSAIAKGYGVDAISALLVERGIENFMVEIGGEVFARGRGASGSPWTLGIETPRRGAPVGSALSATVEVDGKGLASSGGYRNYYLRDGKRYSHFIDPRSGRPIAHRLAAASVLAPSCMDADAAATTVMVLGEKDGLKFLEADPELEGLLLIGDDSGNFRHVRTNGWPD